MPGFVLQFSFILLLQAQWRKMNIPLTNSAQTDALLKVPGSSLCPSFIQRQTRCIKGTAKKLLFQGNTERAQAAALLGLLCQDTWERQVLPVGPACSELSSLWRMKHNASCVFSLISQCKRAVCQQESLPGPLRAGGKVRLDVQSVFTLTTDLSHHRMCFLLQICDTPPPPSLKYATILMQLSFFFTCLEYLNYLSDLAQTTHSSSVVKPDSLSH